MNTGFYNLTQFNTNEKLKAFYQDCINNAYSVHTESKLGESWTREIDINVSIGYLLDNILNTKSHNVFIDRKVQNSTHPFNYEAGFSNILGDSYFLYIYINRKQGNELIKKYKLKQL